MSGRVEVGTVGGGVVDTDLQYTAQGGTARGIRIDGQSSPRSICRWRMHGLGMSSWACCFPSK